MRHEAASTRWPPAKNSRRADRAVERSFLFIVFMFFSYMIRRTQRQTLENVFLIYMTARSPIGGLTSDGAKIRNNFETAKEKEEKTLLMTGKCKKVVSPPTPPTPDFGVRGVRGDGYFSIFHTYIRARVYKGIVENTCPMRPTCPEAVDG